MANPLLAALPARRKFDTPPSPTWTSTERTTGRAARWAIFLRRGPQLSGAVCLFGLAGAATGNMGLRDIGIAGYAVVPPVVLLVMARVFAATPVRETS